MAGLSKLAGVDASEEDVNALVASTVPLGKVGAKWDIAIAAVFLCSSAARHLTGLGLDVMLSQTEYVHGTGSVHHAAINPSRRHTMNCHGICPQRVCIDCVPISLHIDCISHV